MVSTIAGCGFARCYVISEEEGLLVVDVGSTGAAEDVDRFIRRNLRRSPAEIRYIVATHFHIDHIGGIGRLLGKSGAQARVFFHRRVGDYLSGSAKLSRLKNWTAALWPATVRSARYVRHWRHLHFESLVGIPLPGFRSRASVPYPAEYIQYSYITAGRHPIGLGAWEVLETPGHTEDSICLYCEASSELLCGDMILNFEQEGSGFLNRFCWDEQTLLQTFDGLCRHIQPERIYPGHGEVIAGGGNALRNVRTFH